MISMLGKKRLVAGTHSHTYNIQMIFCETQTTGGYYNVTKYFASY